jgi:Domain of unknown function (DUF5615)
VTGNPRLRLMLDADMTSHALLRILEEQGHDVLGAGFDATLQQVDDRLLFSIAQDGQRLFVTHNTHDYPDILREWAETRRPHHGCLLSTVPTNDYGEMERRFTRWFERFPEQTDWIDRVVFL